MSDIGNFDRDIRRESERVVAEAKQFFVAVSQELYAELVQRAWDNKGEGGSPVASGRYAASMRLNLNSIDASVAPADASYRYPPARVHKYNANNLPARTRNNQPASRIAAKLHGLKLGDKIFISNSLPYSRRIEQDAHSWQTRQGVFEVTVRQVLKKFKNARISIRYA